MPKITRSGGILCIGANHAQAVENFRNTAFGKNTMFFASESGVAYASTSGTELYNPNGSGELLSEVPELVARAEFASESSSEDVRAHYTICLDGCGSHIISDNAKSLSNCPRCSCNLAEITDERIQAYLTDEAAEQSSVSHTGLVALGTTAEEAQDNFVAALHGTDVNSVSSAAGDFNAHGVEVKFDPYTGVAVTGQVANAEFASVSAVSEGDEVEAHIYSCSANCAHPFTVSSDDEPVFCAHCSSPLVDSVSGCGDDDEGDTDLDIDEDDMEDEEDEDDFDSESSADEDELDEEEEEDDDFDDSDLDEDEDDLEEDDLEEDEEDYDDEDFDSESNTDPVRSLSLSDDDMEDDSDLDLDEEELEEDDLDLDDEDEDDFDSVSSDADEENEDDLFLDDEDLDDLENDEDVEADELESESKTVSRVFDSLSAVQVSNDHLDPALVSLSRTVTGLTPSIHMFYDGQPIARATFNSVSNAIGEENARRNFDKPAYDRAVEASLRNVGVVETCSSFGFEPHKIEMPVEALLVADADQRINESTTQVTQTIEQSTSAHAERLVAALSTAMLGNTKGFWQNTNNPIVESLCSALNAAGVKDARPLVERAFISHGKDFLSQSMARATKLMAMSEIAQNEVAESVSNAAGVVKIEPAAVEQASTVNNMEQTKGNAALDLLNAHPEDTTSVQSHSSAQMGTFAERAALALRMG